MHEALQRRAAERAERVEQARRYAARLREVLGPGLRAWVVGSVARGDFHDGSDVDVVVVAPALPAHPLARLEWLMRHAPARVEPKGFTSEEWEAERSRGNPLVLEALTIGVPVHGD